MAAGLVLTGAAFARAEDDGPDKEWIAKDRAVVARVAAALPPADRSAAAWLEAMKPWDSHEDRDVGGGARRVVVALYGGYASAYVRALIREDRVTQVRVDCPMEESERAVVDVALKDAWGKVAVTSDATGFHYAWFDATRVRAHRAALDKAFGCRGEVVVPPGLRASFDLLDDGLADVVHGWACGEGGDPPRGREALESIVKARATPLLRALLRSPNPEGRIYAVEGVARRTKDGDVPTPADAAAVAAIRASPGPIETCDGCEHSATGAAEALSRIEDEPKPEGK